MTQGCKATTPHGAGPRRILGVDPGSRVTGFGVVEIGPTGTRYVASGVIRVDGRSLPERLGVIFEQLGAVIDAHHPGEAAVEQVFVHRNPGSALKLGQARGAAILACVTRSLPVAEYPPRLIKQALVGSGGADKDQVAYMVRALLELTGTLREDASDALAAALCHHHRDRLGRLLSQAAVSS